MKKLHHLGYLITAIYLFATSSYAKEERLDRVAAIVNSSVVLESEVTEFLKGIKTQAKANNQSLPSDKALRVQVLDKLINDTLIMDIGGRMGVQISDTELNQTIEQLAKQNNASVEELRLNIIQSGTPFEQYRETIRKELTIGQVQRANVRRRIYISDQDVDNLLAGMKEKTNTDIEYHLGYILIAFPSEPSQEEITDAKTRADKVLKLLEDGGDFAKIAIASSGHDTALKGGDYGWSNINEMPTLFSELVDGQETGSVFGPIRTGLGFSIVKILDIRGREVVEVEEIKARHILIEPSIIVSDAKAESMLKEFLTQIEAGEADFAELAKKHSDGPTGVNGGDLGWSDPSNYVPAFKEALARLDIDEYHPPFKSAFGWHLVQLQGRRMLDATKQVNRNKVYQILFERKFELEAARWLKETRDQAYIEIIERDDS